MASAAQTTVVLVSDVRGGPDRVAVERTLSLWQALARIADTWWLDGGTTIGASAGRIERPQSVQLPGRIDGMPEGTLVISGLACTELARHAAGWSGRVIAAPARAMALDAAAYAALSEALGEGGTIWVRSETEQAHLAGLGEGAPVELLPDAYFPDMLAESARIPGCSGLLADETAPAAALTAAADALLADSQGPVIASGAVINRLGPRYVGQIGAAASDADVLAAAGRYALVGDVATLNRWGALALANEREIVAAGDDDAPRASTALLDMTAVRDAAAALLGLPAEPVEGQGPRLTRNLGVEIAIDDARFQPWVRLYNVSIDLRGLFLPGCLSGRVETRTGKGELVNAWTQTNTPRPEFDARLRATAALAADVSPDDMVTRIMLWGHQVAELSVKDIIVEERAGLIGMEFSGEDKVQVYYWGDDKGTKVQLGRKPVTSKPVDHRPDRPATFRVKSAYPFNRATLTPLPAEGIGQKFTQFPRLDTRYRPTSMKLASMHNAYAGRSAWLIGNGPSVQIDDLDMLAESGQLTFAFNRFHLAHEQTRLRPDFTVTGDDQMIEDFGQQIVDESGGTVFVASGQAPRLSGDYVWVRQISIFPSLFSFDPTRHVTPGGSSLYAAMQIGHYLGIRRWYLIGADFGFKFQPAEASGDVFRSASGDDNHFIKNYRSGRAWCPPSIENILPSFQAARHLMEADGGFIKNATRGGHLEVFERLPFEKALAETLKTK